MMKFATCGGGQIWTGWNARVGADDQPVAAGLEGTAFVPGRGLYLLRYRDNNDRLHSYVSPYRRARGTTLGPTRLRSDAFMVPDEAVWAALNTRGHSLWFKVVADGGGYASFSLEVRSQDRSGFLAKISNRRVAVATWNMGY